MKYALIIDDEPLMRYSLRLTLEQYGLEVLDANDGVAGFDIIKDLMDKNINIEFIILDMMLPKMTGLELIDKLLHLNIHVPIIAISGYLTSEMIDILHEKGIDNTIQKPFTPSVLKKAIDNIRVSNTEKN